MNKQTHDALCVNTGQPKRTDLDMSKVFVGTCRDMCPEKERFMRETRKQLSVFEVIPDTEMVFLFLYLCSTQTNEFCTIVQENAC